MLYDIIIYLSLLYSYALNILRQCSATLYMCHIIIIGYPLRSGLEPSPHAKDNLFVDVYVLLTMDHEMHTKGNIRFTFPA